MIVRIVRRNAVFAECVVYSLHERLNTSMGCKSSEQPLNERASRCTMAFESCQIEPFTAIKSLVSEHNRRLFSALDVSVVFCSINLSRDWRHDDCCFGRFSKFNANSKLRAKWIDAVDRIHLPIGTKANAHCKSCIFDAEQKLFSPSLFDFVFVSSNKKASENFWTNSKLAT